MSKLFSGVGVALVTPFMKDSTIDYNGLKNLLGHVEEKTDYWVIAGTTGESPTLSYNEKIELCHFIRSHNPSGKQIMLGVGGNNTQHVIEEIKLTDFNGIDGILSVVPYYSKPSQEGIIAHFTKIADTSPVPVILYNVPGRTGINMTWQTVAELAVHNNIYGIKEASGDLSQCIRIAKHTPEDFTLISGDDLLTLSMISIGASGVISVLANAFPSIFYRIVHEYGRISEKSLRKTQASIADINPYIYKEGSVVGIKTVLSEMAICDSWVRLPHVQGSEFLIKSIKKELKKIEATS